MIVALLPAHNEQAGIIRAVTALRAQTRPPDRIVVVADNCTDATAALARRAGAEVVETVDNAHQKAGALNQALDGLLGDLDGEDLVLVQDADSCLDPEFIEAGTAAYTAGVGGVGGVFRGRVDADSAWSRMVQNFQANEYARYELDIRRRRGAVLVLTGTATVFRVRILRQVARARRDGILPGAATVYDTRVLTEDNELSFALLRLGYRLTSPRGCTLSTETMPTWRALARQRLRWKRGALENLVDYGWTRTTRPYWGRQLLGLCGVLVTVAYAATLVVAALRGLHLQPFWVGVTGLFAAERMVTVRRRGTRQMLLAAVVVIEMAYDFFLQGVQALAYLHAATNRERSW